MPPFDDLARPQVGVAEQERTPLAGVLHPVFASGVGADRHGVVEADSLHVLVMALDVAQLSAARLAPADLEVVVAEPAKPRERWSFRDEQACTSKCKRCGRSFQWGKIIEDTRDREMVGKWILLDPDGMPHGCGGSNAGRFPEVGTA